MLKAKAIVFHLSTLTTVVPMSYNLSKLLPCNVYSSYLTGSSGFGFFLKVSERNKGRRFAISKVLLISNLVQLESLDLVNQDLPVLKFFFNYSVLSGTRRMVISTE